MTRNTANGKPVAKSLHTVTVIVQVARLLADKGVGANLKSADAARRKQIAESMSTLGLAGRADPYGLADAALKQLTKGN